MLLTLLALNTALAQAPASPEPVLIWVEESLPEEKLQRRAAKLTGSASPWTYTALDLAFPPSPSTAQDDKTYEALAKAVERGDDRWDEFDVELSIADEVAKAIDAITTVRGEPDREALIEAYLMLGAAVDMAFAPKEFAEGDKALPYRIELPGLMANRALLQVLTLDPEKLFTVSEVNSGVAYKNLEALRDTFPSLAQGLLEVGTLPPGATLVLNGREGEPVDTALTPGHYWAHLLVDGAMRGRTEIDVAPGQELSLPRLVDEAERAIADQKVGEDSKEGLPEDIVKAISAISAGHPGSRVYLATLDPDGRLVVLPYTEGAELVRSKPVTLALGAELGGGAVATESYYYWDPVNNKPGRVITAPGASGAFDLELGIYNLALLGGAEVHITPTQHLLFGTDGQTSSSDNQSTPIFLKAHGGVGLYALRPTKYKKPTLLLAGTYGWFSPGHMGPGGRLTIGFPTGPKNWFKITLHGYYGNKVIQADPNAVGAYPDHPLFAGGLRIGFQTAF